LAPLSPDSAVAAAYLFVAACDANGFIREKALNQLRHYPGRVALAASLIRCDDWVPQVRSAAESLLRALVDVQKCHGPLEYLDLVLRMRSRKRIAERTWHDLIIPSLLAPEGNDLRRQWAETGPWRVRRYARELIMRAEPGRLLEVASRAVADKDVPVALWGLSTLALLPAEASKEVLTTAAQHPAAPVRAAAIRRSADYVDEVAKPLLARAIFDVARSPRSAAAYELQRRFAESPCDAWRAALDQSSGRRRKAALLGLCDLASPEDAARLITEASHPNANVRAAVLRGLWRCQARELGSILQRALNDESKSVVRQALNIYGRGSEFLDAVTLASAIESASPGTRRALLAGTRVLEKWQSLEILVHLAASSGGLDSGVVEETKHWLESANRRFTTAPAHLLRALRVDVARLQADRADQVWRAVADVIAHAE
jgi:hypothetical protein